MGVCHSCRAQAFIFAPVAFGIAFASDAGGLRRKGRAWLSEALAGERAASLACVLAAAACGFLALALSTTGFQRVPASQASMIALVEIPTAFLLEFLLFRQVPSTASALGGVCIACACVVSLYSGQSRSSRAATSSIYTWRLRSPRASKEVERGSVRS